MPPRSSPAWLTPGKPPRPTRVTTASPPPALPATPAPASPTPAKRPPGRPRKTQDGEGGNHSGQEAGNVGLKTKDLAVHSDLEALADQVLALAGRPGAAAALRADLPDMLKASIQTAKLTGPIGMGERSTLFRLLGIRLDDKGGGGAAGDAEGAMRRIAERLERAAGMRSRVVEAAYGRDSGTVEAPKVAEPASNLRFDE